MAPRPQYSIGAAGAACFGAGDGGGSWGQPGKTLGNPLGKADGKPMGNGKPLGNGGRDVGNAKGEGGRPASGPDDGRTDGAGRGGAGLGFAGVSVGTTAGAEGGLVVVA